jgi:hypothetical protein
MLWGDVAFFESRCMADGPAMDSQNGWGSVAPASKTLPTEEEFRPVFAEIVSTTNRSLQTISANRFYVSTFLCQFCFSGNHGRPLQEITQGSCPFVDLLC